MKLKKHQIIITINIILVLLISSWFPAYCQSIDSDWLIKRSNPNDTIRCIIKDRDNSKLTYIIDKAAYRVKIAELSHYGLSSFKDSVFTSGDTLPDSHLASNENQKPMLSLYTVSDHSGNRPSWRVEWKHTLPYLKTDPQAMNHVTAARVFGVLKTVSCILAFAFTAKVLADETETNAAYSVGSFAATFVFQIFQGHQIKTAVRTYNKNAGYDYKDGLK